MGERRFVIYETYPEPSNTIANPVFGGTQIVTESELKRRIILAFLKYNPEENNWPQVLPILLHGEGEKPCKHLHRKRGEGPNGNWYCLDCGFFPLDGEGENQHDLPGCEEEAGPNWKGEGEKGPVPVKNDTDATSMTNEIGKNKIASSPTPTRAEWEEWVGNMPYEHQQLGGYGIWYHEMQAWFRTMPIVPKE